MISKHKVLSILYESYGLRDAEKRIADLPTVSICTDAISRSRLKEVFHKNIVNGEVYDELIDAQPSVSVAEKTGRWIPVSERLPEDGQSVLFCDNDNDIMVGYHVKGRPDTHFSQDGTYEDMKNVRAWMPLPTPYEPQESEE